MSLTMSPFGPRSTYNWGQTAETIDITFPVAKGVTARDLVIKVTPTTILAGLKGSESTVVQGLFWGEIADSLWQLESSIVTIHLDKSRQNEQWPLLIRGASSSNERVDPTSEYELGKYAEFSELDDEKAAQHYESAARRGHLQAQLKMAHLLTSGFLKPSGDSSKADADARLYLDMAIMMHDSPEAMVYLANMSFTPENQKRKWLAEAAARLDYPPAMYLLGKYEATSLENRPVSEQKQSASEAIRWWRKAAIMEEARACAELGLVYFRGLLGEKKDPYEAEKFISKAKRLDPSIIKSFQFPTTSDLELSKADFDKTRPKAAVYIPDDDEKSRKTLSAIPDFEDFDINQPDVVVQPERKTSPSHSPRRRGNVGRAHAHASSRNPVLSGAVIGGAIAAVGVVVGAFLLHRFVGPAAPAPSSARFASL